MPGGLEEAERDRWCEEQTARGQFSFLQCTFLNEWFGSGGACLSVCAIYPEITRLLETVFFPQEIVQLRQ